MRTIRRPSCIVCGSSGSLFYSDLQDRIFSAPGKWSLSRCDDGTCGTLWFDPAPDPADLDQAYLDYFTRESGGTPNLSTAKRAYVDLFHGPRRRATVRDRLLASLFALRYRRKLEADDQICHLQIPTRGMRVLDLGCGDGRTLWTLQQLGCEGVGVDFDRQAAEAARARGLNVRVGALDQQEFPDEAFDAILLSHVIEHLPDPLATMEECLRILKPGGQLKMLTPNASSLGHRWFGVHWIALDPPRHLNIFTPRSLERLMGEDGFVEAEAPTTASGADRIAIMSLNIRDEGRAKMLERPGWLRKRHGRALLWLEVLLSVRGSDRGSQIVASAKRASADSQVASDVSLASRARASQDYEARR